MKTTSLNQTDTSKHISLSELFYQNSQEGRCLISRLDIPTYIHQNKELKNIADYFGWSDPKVDNKYLIEAWTHRSFSHESKKDIPTYERWEFLGDAVFGQYITRQLFDMFSGETEGTLSKLKNQLVSGDFMAKIALGLGLDRLMILGRGESQRLSAKNTALLADVFESTIGVLSYCLSSESLKLFLDKLILDGERFLDYPFYDMKHLINKEFKGELQEFTMKKYGVLPEYTSDEIDNKFYVKVYVQNKLLAERIHISKKTAQKICAQEALKQLIDEEKIRNSLC